MKSLPFLFPLLFFLSFVITIGTGLPLILIFVIWQGIFGTLLEVFTWSLLVGALSGVIFWEIPKWLFLMVLSGTLLYLIRTYVFFKITPLIFTLLIFFFIFFWYIVQEQNIILSLPTLIKAQFFLFFLLYPFAYGMVKKKKSHQPRLWGYLRIRYP